MDTIRLETADIEKESKKTIYALNIKKYTKLAETAKTEKQRKNYLEWKAVWERKLNRV